MTDLSILIPSRNEMFLRETIADILKNMRGDTEIIAVLDGAWADPPIQDHGRVTLIYTQNPFGPRAATSRAAAVSDAKYVMKLDAHCTVGKNFDLVLARHCEYDMTMIPAMFNLDVLTWKPREFDNWDQAVRRGKLNPYMYIGWKDGHLRALYYNSSLEIDYSDVEGEQTNVYIESDCFLML